MTISDRNPCPKCGGQPSHVAGMVLFPDKNLAAAHSFTFLVCWKCSMAVRISHAMQWRSVKEMKRLVKQHGRKAA